MHWIFLLVFGLAFSSLRAQEKDEKPFQFEMDASAAQPLFTPSEGSSFLSQVPKVNLITGEYCEEECDLVIAGIEPISIRRFYNHFTADHERIYGHWRMNPEVFMFFNFEPVDNEKTFVLAGERSGNFLRYDQPVQGGFVFHTNQNKGFTNNSCAFSGQNHPLNTQVIYVKGNKTLRHEYYSEEYCWWRGGIKDGSGCLRHFKTDEREWPQTSSKRFSRPRVNEETMEYEPEPPLFKPPYQSQINEEVRPNGNIIRYEYENYSALLPNFQSRLPAEYVLKSIKAYSSSGFFLGSIDIVHNWYSYPKTLKLANTVHFLGSDGRRAKYIIGSREARGSLFDSCLTKAEAAGKPTLNYNYLDFRNQNEGYIHPPSLFQAQEKRCLVQTGYDGEGKVWFQTAPVGLNDERVRISSYLYKRGHTVVYDAENNKTLYRYNGDKRITDVEKYQGDALYSIEKYEWEALTGNLLKRKIVDAKGATFYSAEYIYDANHNVIEERVDGAATIYRTYSTDGFNLKLTESDRPNKEICFRYLPNTNLLSSEFIKLHGAIVKRTFHFYDSQINSFCIKTIIDDGTSTDPNDLRGVTLRHTTERVPKTTLPCVGLTEEIREYAGDELLKKIRYSYHPSGKIAREMHYDAYDQHRYTICYEYDAQENLIAKTDALGNRVTFAYDEHFNLISQQGPRADQTKQWRYDRASRPIQEIEWQSDKEVLISEHRYDKNSRLIATVDPSGFETLYTYDSLGRVIAVSHSDGAVERKEYDVLGNVSQEIDANGFVTRKVCDFRGNPTEIYYPDGTEEHFVYNKIGGTLAEHIDRHGVRTLYIYDLLDNLVRTEIGSAITTASYSTFHLISETDPNGATTYITYDLAGRKIGEKRSKKETHIFYNELGQKSKIQEGDTSTLFFYDLKGQLLEKRIEDCFQENYTYDEAGNKISVTSSEAATLTSYNVRGDPTRIEDPLGNITEITYSYEGGWTKAIRDPKGVTKITICDSRRRPIELQTKNSSDQFIQREERKYDLAGNQTHSIAYIYEEGKLQKLITREWRYGPGGRLEKLIDAGDKETSYFYDDKGRLAKVIKPDGRPIYREYDDLSRLCHYFGEGIDYTYSYDVKNRLVKVLDDIHKTTLECGYDLYDNIVLEKLDSGITVRRQFDPYGRRLALLLPSSHAVSYSYRGPYLQTVSKNGLTCTYSQRNLSGRPTEITLPNDEKIAIEWDPLLRWKSYRAPHFMASYDYDEVGNLIKYNYTDPLGSEESLFRYDDLRQLISEKDHEYSYDSLYNRRSKDGSEYELNDLLQVTMDGQREYEYDKNGNLLSDGTLNYEYDLLDRLVTVITANGKETHYQYDALNRRIAKDDNLYLWDGQQEIGMMRKGKVKELRVLGEGKGAEIGAAVMMELDGKVYIPIHDHRGSLVMLLNMKGKPKETYRYTAFGESLQKNTLCPWGFASKRCDPETGFIYFGKRYYHPGLGRWITPDPQGFQDGPNLYAYVCNNPLYFCDPYGLLARSFSETHNAIEFFGLMWNYTCSAVEWVGHNLIPIPGMRDFVEATGRFGRGGDFFQHREYACVMPSSGINLTHISRTYQNGILTNASSGKKQRDEISKANGGVQVDLLFNPSHGFACDLISCIIAKCGIKTSYEKMCADYYASKLDKNPEHEFFVTAHSQGCSRLQNTGNILTVEQCQHITVEAFGSATIISEGRFKKVNNFLSKLDPVPWTSTWSYVKNVVGFDSNVTFLTPHSMNPLTEHYLLGDTYAEKIKTLGNDFVQKYLPE